MKHRAAGGANSPELAPSSSELVLRNGGTRRALSEHRELVRYAPDSAAGLLADAENRGKITSRISSTSTRPSRRPSACAATRKSSATRSSVAPPATARPQRRRGLLQRNTMAFARDDRRLGATQCILRIVCEAPGSALRLLCQSWPRWRTLRPRPPPPPKRRFRCRFKPIDLITNDPVVLEDSTRLYVSFIAAAGVAPASTIHSTKSAAAARACARRTPSCSTGSSLARMPAVSSKGHRIAQQVEMHLDHVARGPRMRRHDRRPCAAPSG